MEMLKYICSSVGMTTVILCLVILLALRVIFKARYLPPGPWGFPWLGMVPYFWLVGRLDGVQRHEALAHLAARYGKVFSFTVLGKLVLVLSNKEAVEEVFRRQELNDRPKVWIKNGPKGEGLATASGEAWKQQRAFTVRILDKFGVGKPAFEEKIAREARSLLSVIAKKEGQSFDPKHLLMLCVSNVITELLFSTKHEYGDADYMKHLDAIREITHLMGSSGAANSVYLLSHIPTPSRIRLAELLSYEANTIEGMIKTHLDILDRGNLRDYLDEYLNEMLSTCEEGLQSEISRENLNRNLSHLFLAGTENISTTLRWSLLFMIGKPDVQARVQAELDRVVGRERLPTLADEPSLPYTRATMLEIQRAASTAALGAAHRSSRSFSYRGWTIPADTTVICNVWAIHNDPEIWQDPAEFKPERFLGEDNEIIKDACLIPFSAGNRVCVGRHLARMEIFVFFSHLMHRFHFRKVGNSPVSFQGHGSFAREPLDFQVEVTERK
ncbi:cytochrome P450 2F2-like [Patiria miniata]|uniref:Cytochrome P450 n=1 Tax=Patiria miniata TaxID=46514 RepID=A0A914ACL5_PATMI|nr:cytochrome P450 2F2-like [Patiria miniata]